MHINQKQKNQRFVEIHQGIYTGGKRYNPPHPHPPTPPKKGICQDLSLNISRRAYQSSVLILSGERMCQNKNMEFKINWMCVSPGFGYLLYDKNTYITR